MGVYVHGKAMGFYNVGGMIIPNIWKNEKCSKPSTSDDL